MYTNIQNPCNLIQFSYFKVNNLQINKYQPVTKNIEAIDAPLFINNLLKKDKKEQKQNEFCKQHR